MTLRGLLDPFSEVVDERRRWTPDWYSFLKNEILDPLSLLLDQSGGTTTAPILALALPQGRLTLTSGAPLTVADVVTTTLYYTPAIGRLVPLWDGTKFVSTDIGGELSNSTLASAVGKAGPAPVAANSVYDLYVWSDAGTCRLTRSPPWLSDTSRGTGAGTAELEFFNGVWVNKVAITNGPVARLGTLVGSVRSDASAQLRDSAAFRWVSNIYNVAARHMRVVETTDNWTYTTATYRQANNSAVNQIDWLHSLDGVMTDVTVAGGCNNTNAGVIAAVAIGIDSITVTAECLRCIESVSNPFDAINPMAFWRGCGGMGRHYATWLEYSGAAGTTTWSGDNGLLVQQSGIHGWTVN